MEQKKYQTTLRLNLTKEDDKVAYDILKNQPNVNKFIIDCIVNNLDNKLILQHLNEISEQITQLKSSENKNDTFTPDADTLNI